MILNYSIILLVILVNTIFSIDLELIAKGFKKPIYVCSPNNEQNNLYVVEQRGKIIKIKDNEQKSIFLDITNRVKEPGFFGDERGLLGLAFHPEYKDNGYFFINYIDNNETTIISKFKFDKEKFTFNETVLLSIKQPYSNHNGGHLEFGKDGFLYIATGDGGSAGDPEGNAQNLSSLLGKILRIDINDSLYSIPDGNPFVNNENARDEIWAYGLRNPWKFSFDNQNSLIFIADVGQNSWEELNVQDLNIAGINYGWNIKEGKHIYKDNYKNNLIDPLFEYSSNANYGKTLTGLKQTTNVIGCSITGGYVYNGHIKKIQTQYFFGDYCTGKIWSIKDYESSGFEVIDWTNDLVENNKQLYISSFGKDASGELYIVDHSGTIYKIIEER